MVTVIWSFGEHQVTTCQVDERPFGSHKYHLLLKRSCTQPGRIRLKISLSALSLFDAPSISRSLHAIPGVVRQRINLRARSVVIEYDRKLLPYDLWELLGQIRCRPELTPVASELMQILWR